jgi:hypothetical protein
MGADQGRAAEMATAELARVRVFCDDWEQASYGGNWRARSRPACSARGT